MVLIRLLCILISIMYLIDLFVIRRAKKGKRTIIPLLIVGAIFIFWAFLCFLGMLEGSNFSTGIDLFILNTLFILNIIVIIFVSDYIANKHKK